jgi:hypothetical protein
MNLRFNIYLRRFGKLAKLYKVHRNASGLYLWSRQSNDYISYHEDRRYWIRFLGNKTVKKLRQRLSDSRGEETLSVSYNMVVAPMPQDKDEGLVRILPEDIVLDMNGHFAVEIILSAGRLNLLPDPQRPDSLVYVRDSISPVIIVEAFQVRDNVLSFERFRSNVNWFEGDNFFVDHQGRI